MDKEALRKWRSSMGMKQVTFARLLGVDVSTVVRWENGSRAIPPYMVWVLRAIEQDQDPEAEYDEPVWMPEVLTAAQLNVGIEALAQIATHEHGQGASDATTGH